MRNNINALMKWIYNKAFDWLVRKINQSHGNDNRSRSQSQSHSRGVCDKFVGILDIFGFEVLGVNSFEQLCINFTNERLQKVLPSLLS